MLKIAVLTVLFLALAQPVLAQTSQSVVDIPSRPGVSQRLLLLTPPSPKAAVILLAGGHGGLQIFQNGTFRWGAGNFLVRSRQLFADQGLAVAVLDAPSDRQSPPFLNGFRQTAEHATDIKATIAWLRAQTQLPVWLIGTSRGTQSAAFAALELAGRDAPDGLVLSSSIVTDRRERSVASMPLSQLRIPVLVVHHEQDACALCRFSEAASMMDRLTQSPRKQLLAIRGGESHGDPCEAFAHHGFNGIEADVVAQTAAWITASTAH
ncbi:MAG: alpha/beta hydrolase [Comamonadaceae bacterium]